MNIKQSVTSTLTIAKVPTARITRNGSVVPVSKPKKDPRVNSALFTAPVSIAATQRLATYKNKSKSLLVGKKQSKDKDDMDTDEE